MLIRAYLRRFWVEAFARAIKQLCGAEDVRVLGLRAVARLVRLAAMALAWLALLTSPAMAAKARAKSVGKDPLSIAWRWALVTCLGPSHDRPGGSGTRTDRRPLCTVGPIWGTLESRTISPFWLKFDRRSPPPRMPAPPTLSTGEGPPNHHLRSRIRCDTKAAPCLWRGISSVG